jgi:hypothetical protein
MAISCRGAIIGASASAVAHAVNPAFLKRTLCGRAVMKRQLSADDQEWDREDSGACLMCKGVADDAEEL